jgi:hypothetical protein
MQSTLPEHLGGQKTHRDTMAATSTRLSPIQTHP